MSYEVTKTVGAFGAVASALYIAGLAGGLKEIGMSMLEIKMLLAYTPHGLGLGFMIDTLLGGRRKGDES